MGGDGVKPALRGLWGVIRALLYGWIIALIGLIRRWCAICRRRHDDDRSEHERKTANTTCVPIQDPAYVRPDPLIYSQPWLAAHGYNVVWDNPDFTILHLGTPVPSHALQPATAYDVVVRVWNASVDGPVVEMPVHLSYLSFGIGTVSNPVGTRKVDVGVKGGSNNPALVTIPWTTPATPGHYCLQALLDPADDADFGNNLGQHNTDVAIAASPATFSFTLENHTGREHRYFFMADTYHLGKPRPCVTREDGAQQEVQKAYHQSDHPLPPGWTVAVVPPTPTLVDGAAVSVIVTVTPPATFTGSQTINVQGYYRENYEDRLAGGVTVTVKKGP